MGRKLFLMLLVCLFSVFVASQSLAETAYKLIDSNGNGVESEESSERESYYIGGNFYCKYRLPALQLVSYDKDEGDAAEEYPVDVNFKIKWIVIQNIDGIDVQIVSKDVSGDFLILSGMLPATTTSYEEGDGAANEFTYQRSFRASISEIEGEEYQALVGETSINFPEDDPEEQKVSIYGIKDPEDDDKINQFTTIPDALMKKLISEDIESLEELKDVSSGYSVTVNANKDELGNYQN